MLGESVAYPIHATLLSKSPAKATWTSNARTNLRTKKSLGQTLPPNSVLAHFGRVTCLAKMPLLQLPNCQRSSVALRQAQGNHPVTIYRAPFIDQPIAWSANGQRPTRQCIPPWKKCLTSLWPLAVACPPMSWLPLRRNRTIYRPAGAVSNFVQDRFYACLVRGQGAYFGIFSVASAASD
jgi:hypothetical protein